MRNTLNGIVISVYYQKKRSVCSWRYIISPWLVVFLFSKHSKNKRNTFMCTYSIATPTTAGNAPSKNWSDHEALQKFYNILQKFLRQSSFQQRCKLEARPATLLKKNFFIGIFKYSILLKLGINLLSYQKLEQHLFYRNTYFTILHIWLQQHCNI